MKKNLLSFLFLESAEAEAATAGQELDLADSLEQLFEAAADIEKSELESKQTPLATALSGFGIDDSDLQLDPEGFCLVTDNRQRYADILAILGDAAAMHKLAEMGWVVTKPGDVAMTGEPAEYRIRFLEITTVNTGDKDKPDEKAKAINQAAREFATTPLDRDDDLNPVETDDGKMGKRQAGVGKAKDGTDPEGTPKGAGKVKEALISEMTSTGSMGTVETGPQGVVGAGLAKKPKPYGKGTKFAMPGQWTVRQPIVKQQTKRHPTSEAIEGQGPGGTPPPRHFLHPDHLKSRTPANGPVLPTGGRITATCPECGNRAYGKFISSVRNRPNRMEYTCPVCGGYWEESTNDPEPESGGEYVEDQSATPKTTADRLLEAPPPPTIRGGEPSK